MKTLSLLLALCFSCALFASPPDIPEEELSTTSFVDLQYNGLTLEEIRQSDYLILPMPHENQSGYWEVFRDDDLIAFTGIFSRTFPKGAQVSSDGYIAEGGFYFSGWFLPTRTWMVLQADDYMEQGRAPDGEVVMLDDDLLPEVVGKFVMIVDPFLEGNLNVKSLYLTFSEPTDIFGVVETIHKLELRKGEFTTANACVLGIEFGPAVPGTRPCLVCPPICEPPCACAPSAAG